MLDLATELAVKISQCKTVEELFVVRKEIQAHFDKDPTFKKEWKDWLVDIRDGHLWFLSLPDKPFEETLNAEGLKALKRGELN